MTMTMMVMMTMMTMTMTMMVILPRCFLKWWVGVKRQRLHFPTSSPRPLYPPLVTFHTNIAHLGEISKLSRFNGGCPINTSSSLAGENGTGGGGEPGL